MEMFSNPGDAHLTKDERQARMAMMIARQASQEHHDAEADIEAAFKRLDEAEAKLARRLASLSGADGTWKTSEIEAAEAAVVEAEHERHSAQAAIEWLRGDDCRPEQDLHPIAPMAPCADRQKRWTEATSRATAKEPESPAQRQARRFRMCTDAGLEMPNNDYAPLPRGIGKLAKLEGITRQAFSEDVKAHIRRMATRKHEK